MKRRDIAVAALLCCIDASHLQCEQTFFIRCEKKRLLFIDSDVRDAV